MNLTTSEPKMHKHSNRDICDVPFSTLMEEIQGMNSETLAKPAGPAKQPFKFAKEAMPICTQLPFASLVERGPPLSPFKMNIKKIKRFSFSSDLADGLAVLQGADGGDKNVSVRLSAFGV